MAEGMENIMSAMNAEDDNGSSAEEDAHLVSRAALQHTYTKCLELLNPDIVLDLFVERGLFCDKIKVRDIRELPSTTAKNRAIYDTMSRDPSKYKEFKFCLAQTRQIELLDALEMEEEEGHTKIKANGHRCIGETTGACDMMTSLKCIRDLPEYVSQDVRSTQKDLISLYNKCRQKIPIYPLIPEWREDVNKLFVKPNMIEMNPQGYRTFTDQKSSKSTNKNLKDLRDIFYSGEKSYKDIYLVAESGSGKTTLCEYLIYLWVNKHSRKTSDNRKLGDESIMEEFMLLFYISLREANRMCKSNIEDMIRSQFSSINFQKYGILKLISEYPCLIILDGLDEYSQKHQYCTEYVSANLPWRCHSDKCTILTTSRPWKMELLTRELENNIDRQIRITGLETKSQEDLANIVITLLNSKDGVEQDKNFNDFICDMKKQHLDKYMETPILLLQMLGLWFDGESFGKFQCEIYGKMIDKQIQFAEEVKEISAASKTKEPHSVELKQNKGGLIHRLSMFGRSHWFSKHRAEASIEEEYHSEKLPSCFKIQRYCKTYQGLLLKLSKLAYHHLFGKQESALVFDHDQMEIMELSEEEIQCCLHLGLLTQYKVLGKITERQKSISFVHKSHQEFFAAIYLWKTGFGSELKQLLARFTDLDRALQIDKVFTFVAGMNPNVSLEIARVIIALASQDARIQQYRDSCILDDAPNEGLVQQIQGVILAAIEESRNNGRGMPAIILQDIWMKGGHLDYAPSRILAVTEYLQLSNVKSIFINTPSDIPCDVIQRWVKSPTQLSKIVLCGCEISASRVVKLVTRNRDSLHALGLYYQGVERLDLCRLSHKKLKMILSPRSLGLNLVVISHVQLELMYKHLGRRPHTEVLLSRICCQRQGFNGCKPRLDLSTSTELLRLQLCFLPIQDATFEPKNLLCCSLEYLPDNVASHALQRLTEASRLEEFSGCSLTETALVELVRTLPQLNTLTYIRLANIDLRHQEPIVLHNATALEQIDLVKVTLTAKQLPQLLLGLPSRSVLVCLGDIVYGDWPVTITNRDCKDNLIQHIAASPHTTVLTKHVVEYENVYVVKEFSFDHKQ